MIEVEHVSKTFGKVTALSDVSMRIGRGERVALTGSNGSGKTTLLRALCGLVRVTGQLRIGGHDVAQHPERALAHLAYIPQQAPPLDAPTSELVRAYAALRGIALKNVHAYATELGLPLASIGRTRIRDLSGGMKQKLLSSLALAAETPVLICDEPTASLDQRAREAFFALVKARPKESVLVLCSHRTDDLEALVARTVELRDGRVVAANASLPDPAEGQRMLGLVQVLTCAGQP
ncbi:MAG: hypothetical protein RL385_1294 [Pseudomonadota bacterium]|jgi:ABC-2 type transport system ATP-binding protein